MTALAGALVCILWLMPLPPGSVRSVEPVPEPIRTAPPRSTSSITGQATWYRWHAGEAAAGPGLRKALGRTWRGRTVTACSGGRCVRVRLTDWCLCRGERIIDLDVRAFGRLAPPSRGVIRVEVKW